MMKKTTALLLIFSLCFSMTACSQAKTNETTNEQTTSSEASTTEEYSSVETASEESSFSAATFTTEQMLQDYDAMWDAMKENYPFWGVLERNHPEDPHYYDAVIADYRTQLQEISSGTDKSMYQFIEIIAYSLYDVCGSIGHVSIINPNYFHGLDVYKEHLDDMPEVKPWVDVLEKPEVNAFYNYYEYLFSLPEEELIDNTQNNEESTEDTSSSIEEETTEQDTLEQSVPENLTMEIIEKGKTAYIRVDSFDDSFIKEDLPKISSFMEEVKDYKNLIIDIQNNGGGNTEYWEDAFVKPNITEPITDRLIRLMNDSPLAKQFYYSSYEDSSLTIEDITNDSKFNHLVSEDMASLSFARELANITKPLNKEKLFNGNIWLLVGPNVYSSAEALAVFCKESGFATLVGTTTGGSDSGGPILYDLPNSHLLIQFDVEYCLNTDGSCNQEVGTTPDIESDHALDTVLKLIKK